MKQKSTLTIYVEGGGDNRSLLRECQRAFKLFFERAGLPARGFTVQPCGSRQAAYEDYCTALANGENALLLVDGEDPIKTDRSTGNPVSPWQHVAERNGDKWKQPTGSTDDDVQLMAPVMEAWFIADRETLASYYEGKFRRDTFNASAIPKRLNVEELSKVEINTALENATRSNKTKRAYHKGNHSFELLGLLDPRQVAASSYHARRLFCRLSDLLKAAIEWLDCEKLAIK